MFHPNFISQLLPTNRPMIVHLASMHPCIFTLHAVQLTSAHSVVLVVHWAEKQFSQWACCWFFIDISASLHSNVAQARSQRHRYGPKQYKLHFEHADACFCSCHGGCCDGKRVKSIRVQNIVSKLAKLTF